MNLSHLLADCEPQKGFDFSIHSNQFFIMTPTELRRAYEVKTHTKSVDYFALAIQMLLVIHNRHSFEPQLKRPHF